MPIFHGVSVAEVSVGARPIQVIRSAVIGLVGSGAQWLALGSTIPYGVSGSILPAPNTPTQVANIQAMSAFGELIQGYTLPYALNAISQQGAQSGVGPVVVVDVLDLNVHYTSRANITFTFPSSNAQVINLGHMGIINNGSLVVTNSGGTTTYVLNTDYTIDWINGIIMQKTSGAMTPGETVEVTYNYVDPSKVTSVDIVGAVTASVYTGMQAFLKSFSLFGYWPKILIAPGFSSTLTVAQGLQTIAKLIRAVTAIDNANGTIPASAEGDRNVIGNVFNVASDRVILLSPNWEFVDTGLIPTGVTVNAQTGAALQANNNSNSVGPYSQWYAGVVSANDFTNGYWWSPSNKPVNGVYGPDVDLYLSAFDPNADNQLINQAGIVTMFNSFGTGWLVWGNRSSFFPSNTGPTNFISVRRTLDVIEESCQIAMLQFIDAPINNGLINTVLATINAFLRTLIQQGALVTGSVASFNAGLNPKTNLANGIIVFSLNIMPPTPAENIQLNVYVDTNLLGNIGPTQKVA